MNGSVASVVTGGFLFSSAFLVTLGYGTGAAVATTLLGVTMIESQVSKVTATETIRS